jgi:DNA primase
VHIFLGVGRNTWIKYSGTQGLTLYTRPVQEEKYSELKVGAKATKFNSTADSIDSTLQSMLDRR